MNKQDLNFGQPESMQQPMITHHQNLKMKTNSNSKLDFDQYVLLKYSPVKIALVSILSLATCFLIWIPILKSDSFRKIILFQEVIALALATHVYIKQTNNNYLVKITQKQQHLSFQFKKVFYYFENQTPVRYKFKPQNSKYFSQHRQQFKNKGLNQQQQQNQRKKFGKCEHVFQVPSLGLFLVDTLTGPFFILQYFTCLVYIWETFYLFSIIMIGTSLITTFINYYLLRRSVLKIKESTEKYTKVMILCNGQFIEKDSQQIVPGDIIKPPKNMPCDALLIEGGVFVNQSTLTGESLPIQKTVIQDHNELNDQKHWLYQGSIVVEQRANPLALVVETGFNTRKGQSFRTMLDHNYEQPRFVRSGFLFMLQLLIICCVIFGIMIPIMIYKKLQSRLIIMRFLDMLGWAIPPTFPIFFNICYSFTLYRLEKRKIFATEPTKTVTAGKLKNIYFDKTGTLTLNKIQFSKVTLFLQNGATQQLQINDTTLDPQELSTKIFSSCHSARVIQNELMGDEVDVRMFEKSGYNFQTSNNTKIKALYKNGENCIEAIRINQYQSQNRSMSALIRDAKTNQYYVVVKGSPQKLAECSVNEIKDYNDIVFKMSLEGLRLIAYGYKKVDNHQKYLNSDIKQFQADLILLGLMGFSNELRPESEETINLLKDSGINIAMITGDNIWTGIQAATRTGIISKQQQVLVIQGNKQKQQQQPTFTGLLLNNKNKKINQLKQISISLSQFHNSSYTLAVDSNFLNIYPELINSHIKVFARSKPETKLHIITTIQNRLQQQWQNRPFFTKLVSRTPYAVAMVGDGANDVMAIKGANVGIGINDCDSSFASDYSIDKLTDVEYVLRSGKTTLSIVLDMFRYYGSISVLKFTTTCIMSLDRSNYSDNQFTYFNYMQSIEIVVLMSLTLPIKQRTICYPNDNLLSFQNHLLFHGMIILPTLALFIIYQIASHLPGYILNPEQQYYTWQFKCMTNTVLSLASQCFYVSNAFIIYTSYPWKQQIWKNKVLIAWLAISAISLTIYFFITQKLDAFFGYVYIPQMALVVTISVVIGFIGLEQLWKRVIRCFRFELSE